ncbi:MAG: hypothetical protein Q9160_007525 [Pyrenula sp. 1 TL-2023]
MNSNHFKVSAAGGVTEVFDFGIKPATYTAQDYVKEVARQRQHRLAGELSRLDAAEYQNDILAHMLEMDADTVADVDSIDIQTEIQWYMRPYLLDFLIEAHGAFQLLPETLFLTVNLLDRYCSKRVVYKRHYQLVGCAALLIAAKYGDKKERVPTIQELKSMCCMIYDEDMFLQMEWHVLSTLDWIIGHPTMDNFLRLAVKDHVHDPEGENLTLYILEIALFHREFVSRKASTLALSALALARHILGRPQARPMEWASDYCQQTLLELFQKIQQPSNIVSRKYASARYCRVAQLLADHLARHVVVPVAQSPIVAVEPTSFGEKQSHGAQFGLSTPQKPQPGSTAMFHGYPTPPETPEDEYFGMQQKALPVGQRMDFHLAPPTPSPSGDSQSHTFTFDYKQPQYHSQSTPWY